MVQSVAEVLGCQNGFMLMCHLGLLLGHGRQDVGLS